MSDLPNQPVVEAGKPYRTEVLPAGSLPAQQRAAALVHAGELVAFPTDTVYGLGARLDDLQAIERLYQVKERDSTKAIPVLLSDPAELEKVTLGMGELALKLARRFWPGPLTLVVARHPSLPENLSPMPTIGVRMPNHPDALALLRLTGPQAVTSANLSGQESAGTAEEVLAQLGGRIPLILDGGRVPGGAPSTVVDCTGLQPVVLRPGPISLEALLQALA